MLVLEEVIDDPCSFLPVQPPISCDFCRLGCKMVILHLEIGAYLQAGRMERLKESNETYLSRVVPFLLQRAALNKDFYHCIGQNYIIWTPLSLWKCRREYL